MSERHQEGYIFEAYGGFHVRYYVTEPRDGKLERVQKSRKLCRKEGKYKSTTCKAVRLLAQDFLRTINTASPIDGADMRIVDFWSKVYLPQIKARLKPTTVGAYLHVWNKILAAHFGDLTLQGYEGRLGQRFLRSLSDSRIYNRTSLKHVRALASAIFTTAVEKEIISHNPWRDIVMPRDARIPESTKHYTLEAAEDMISALVVHVDGQLVIALACFLGLGPAEIAGLQWRDIEQDWIHIRRNKMYSATSTPKTQERMAPVPIIDQVRVPLELWRSRSAHTAAEDWVISDLKNLTQRCIKAHVVGRYCKRCDTTIEPCKGVTWHGLYAGRRGACTAVVEATNGNYAVAQALLRHKSMTTTLNVYKKAITQRAFVAGMKQLEDTLGK